jgi:hypothetical protein
MIKIYIHATHILNNPSTNSNIVQMLKQTQGELKPEAHHHHRHHHH